MNARHDFTAAEPQGHCGHCEGPLTGSICPSCDIRLPDGNPMQMDILRRLDALAAKRRQS